MVHYRIAEASAEATEEVVLKQARLVNDIAHGSHLIGDSVAEIVHGAEEGLVLVVGVAADEKIDSPRVLRAQILGDVPTQPVVCRSGAQLVA